jgi:hypothetical protein
LAARLAFGYRPTRANRCRCARRDHHQVRCACDRIEFEGCDEIKRYLCTGDTDIKHIARSGGFTERIHRAHDDLRGALLQRFISSQVEKASPGAGR